MNSYGAGSGGRFSNYYEILGVGRNATEEEIKSAWRREAKRWHPDMNADKTRAHAMFIAVTEAYEVLRDPVRRREYDRMLDAVTRQVSSQATQTTFSASSSGTSQSARTSYQSEPKMSEWANQARKKAEEYVSNPQSFWEAISVKDPEKFSSGMSNLLGGCCCIFIVVWLIGTFVAPYVTVPFSLILLLTYPAWRYLIDPGWEEIRDSFKSDNSK